MVNPPLDPGQTGLMGYNAPTVVILGAGTLNGVATQNMPGFTGACNLYDCATLNGAATPLATIDADASSAGLGLAFTQGLVIVPAPGQVASIAVTLAPTATIYGRG